MPSYEPTINHFSHPHSLLQNSNQDLPLAAAPCTCCKSPPSASCPVYTCMSKDCDFLLHAWCTTQPQLIIHPSHTAHHPLKLVRKPAYPSGYFKCNGCGLPGDGFSFHCSSKDCSFDLHVVCAAKPLKVNHVSHCHELSLSFSPPYITKGFSCNICGSFGGDQWLYRCGSCNFDAHLWCATTTAAAQPQPHDQYYRSFGYNPAIPQSSSIGTATSVGPRVYIAGQVAGGCIQAVIGSLMWS